LPSNGLGPVTMMLRLVSRPAICWSRVRTCRNCSAVIECGASKIASLALYAPACTVEFANATFKPAVESGQLNGRRFVIHNLSDRREQEDSVGPYGKSLLYLVSRALELVHKTPILGLARSFEPRFNGTPQWNDENVELRDRFTAELKAWQKFWSSLPGPAESHLVLEDRPSVRMGSVSTSSSCPVSHGCFDNHAEALNDAIQLITGRKPVVPVEDLDY